MFNDDKVTKIYCSGDNFYWEFTFQQTKYLIEDHRKDIRYRNKANRISDAKIIAISKQVL